MNVDRESKTSLRIFCAIPLTSGARTDVPAVENDPRQRGGELPEADGCVCVESSITFLHAGKYGQNAHAYLLHVIKRRDVRYCTRFTFCRCICCCRECEIFYGTGDHILDLTNFTRIILKNSPPPSVYIFFHTLDHKITFLKKLPRTV
ncbi:unnamed protein product [Sphacelaria rigidula]